MKAIHNGYRSSFFNFKTVFIPTKIQNESNSQQELTMLLIALDCIYPYKDTK